MSKNPSKAVTVAESGDGESTTPNELHGLTRKSLSEIRQKISPKTLKDEHIIEISRLADEHVEAPRSLYPEAHYANIPVSVGSVLLYPLSIGAQIWLRDTAFPALGNDAFLGDMAVAYALSQDSEDLQDLCEPKRIRKAVRSFCFKAGCTYEDLMDAVQEQLPKGDGGGGESQELSKVLSLLQAKRGQTFEYWIWAPVAVVDAALKGIQAEHDAQSESKGKGAKAPDPNSRLVQTLYRLKERLREIAEEYNA